MQDVASNLGLGAQDLVLVDRIIDDTRRFIYIARGIIRYQPRSRSR